VSRADATRRLLGFVLFVGGGLMGALFSAACSENLHPGTTRKDVCDAVGDSYWSWLAAALWPAALYGASQLVPVLRRHYVVAALAVGALGLAFWTLLLLIASSKLLAD
jgi:hypothetical protein